MSEIAEAVAGHHERVDGTGYPNGRTGQELSPLAHLVAAAPHPLQPGCDARWRLDLDHEIDRAHVDAQLQAGGGHDAGQHACLQLLFHERALLA